MKTTRRIIQLGFLILTLVAVFVIRGNAEAWCPFGGVEALYTYISEGNLTCSLAVSNFYILAAVVVMTLLLRRAFCSYMCPIGTLSEWLQAGAARLGIKAVTVPPQADRVLSMLKYVVLAVILYFTYRTSELVFRGYDPCYALLSRHGEDITIWAYVIAGVLIVASVVLMLPFCRWLCPLAAVLNPFSRFGVTRIRRDVDACVECGECTVACPMAIPVDRLTEVRAARCTSCMSCIQECPGGAEGALSWGPAGRKRRHWPQGVLVALLLACTAGAVAANFALPLPSYVKTRGELSAATATVELRVAGLGCRGNASLLMYFLERDDLYELPGYLKLEAWPGPGAARTRITYDPTECDEDAIKEAITEPYHDQLEQRWRYSPFEIEGYDQLGADDEGT